jgi:hypothetical protein
MLREGSKVSYIGDGRDGRTLGERGTLLVISGAVGHVQWLDGTLTPHYTDDLAPLGRIARIEHDELADSLDVGPVVHVGVRAVYESEGSAGVLNQLSATGALTGFAEIAEEARTLVASRIRSDPGFRAVVAQLDDDEGEDLVALASHVLLRDAFSDTE